MVEEAHERWKVWERLPVVMVSGRSKKTKKSNSWGVHYCTPSTGFRILACVPIGAVAEHVYSSCVGSFCDEVKGHISVASLDRKHESSLAADVPRLEISAIFQEKTGDFEVPMLARKH
jgi:hypothetical protein